MADPIPALASQTTPEGFIRYELPGGRNVFLSKQLTKEQVDQAIGGLVDQGVAQTLADPLGMKAGAKGVVKDVREAYSAMASPVTRAISKGFQAAGETGLSPYSLKEPSDVLAKGIVPQTLPEAGMALGTGGAGAIAARVGLKQLPAAAMRVLGGGIGGAAGAATTGEDPLVEGAKGLVGGMAGEVVGKGVEVARRGITNLTGGLYARDAKAVASAVGELVPTLKGAKDTKEFRDLMLSGTGRGKLMDRLMAGYDRTKVLIGNQPLDVPSLGGAISFDAARKEMRDLFKQGWGPSDINVLPTPSVFAARDKFHQVMQEVQSELVRVGGPQGRNALKEFVDARTEFRTGMNIIDMIRRANGAGNRLFRPSTDAPKFQTNVLQGVMSSQEATLRKRLSPKVYERIAQEVFRGAPPGAGDTPGLYLGRLFTRQAGPSGGLYERFPITSIPQYAGRPFQAGGGGQTLLDLIAQRGLSIPGRPAIPGLEAE